MNWLSVRKQKPEPGAVVLAWSASDYEVVVAGYDPEDREGHWSLQDPYCTHIKVSHWMPLPEKPKGVK